MSTTAHERSIRWRVAVSVLLTAAVVLVGACSSDDDSASNGDGSSGTTTEGTSTEDASSQAGDGADSCSLLTTADLESATGVSFGEGEKNESLSSGSTTVCDWTSSGSEYATAQVLIVAGGADNVASQKAGTGAVSATSDVSVAGAESAYQTEEGSIVGMAVGGDFLQVSYIPSGPGNVNEETLQLAETAVANFSG